MKLKLAYLLVCALVPMLVSADQPANQPAPHSDKIPYDLHDEHDKTDIYAIQLDSSEEEEKEEAEELEKLQKEEQAKKK